MSDTFQIVLLFILILFSAFFVATEFAIIKLRSSRIEQLVNEGNKNAKLVKSIRENLNIYLSACQLGITITAIGIGWLGEPTVDKLLNHLLLSMELSEGTTHTISFITSFVFITFLHVVFGELVPKTIAIQEAERISLFVARPIYLFFKLMYPIIWSMNALSNLLVRLLGFKIVEEEEEALPEEELKLILSNSYKNGLINQTEYKYVNNVFNFDEKLAKEIMVPRVNMVCLSLKNSLKENIEIIQKEQFTRIPVMGKDKDDIVGIFNTKLFFLEQMKNPSKTVSIEEFIQPACTLIDNVPLKIAFKELQKKQNGMLILIDEYGGTSGLITIEDIVEQIVGDINDETDEIGEPKIKKVKENTYIIDSKIHLNELNEKLQTSIVSEENDTFGGWVYSQIPQPTLNQAFEFLNYSIKVVDVNNFRINKIELTINKQQPSN